MANTGAYPVDPTTETGLFRQELGDINGTPADPQTNPPTAEYEFISDAAIAALILAYPSSRDTAMAKALSSAAFQLIAAAEDIQVDDIKIKTIERAKLMLEYATTLNAGAVSGDAASAFTVVPLSVTPPSRYFSPQGVPSPWPGMM